MSEVRNIHYMTKEYLDSLNFPDVVIEELDKAGKHLSIVSKEQRQMTREEAECESVIETEIVKLSDVLEILDSIGKGEKE